MRRSLRLILLVVTVLIATVAPRCLADSRPLQPGPVKITVSGTLPASGKVGTEGASEFTAQVADGSGKGEKVTWKWVATVISVDPNSEHDGETGIISLGMGFCEEPLFKLVSIVKIPIS